MTENQLLTAQGPATSGPLLMHIADRVIGRPLMLHPAKMEVILSVLQGRIPLDASGPLSPEASRFVGTSDDGRGGRRTARREGSVALIDVHGSLVNRGAWIGASSGLTSYEGLSKQLDDVRRDAEAGDVSGVILDMNSPGGEVGGLFTAAGKVAALAAVVPVVAFVNDMACSACYALASQATEIVASDTSIIGSIGVVLTHFDRSGEMERRGVAATFIHAGAHKVDGHPFGPLSDAVRADLQAEINAAYDQFVGLVGKGRGDRLTEQAARATEARTFTGQEAVKRGLADRVASFEAVLASLQSQPKAARRGGPYIGGQKMPENENSISAEAHAQAVAAATEAGRKAGAEAATARIGAILKSDAAKTRPSLAGAFAFDSDMSAETAVAMLEKAAHETGPETKADAPADNGPAARAEGLAEIGGAYVPTANPAEASRSGWAKAGKAASKGVGAA